MLGQTPNTGSGGRYAGVLLSALLVVSTFVCLCSSVANAASATSAPGEHSTAELNALRESPKVPQITLPEANGEHGEAPQATSPEAPAAGTEGADGLNPGEAVPKWANHALVHFYPPVPRSSAVGAVKGAALKAIRSATLKVEPMIAGAGGQKLTYHGGYVQREPRLYLLSWGSNLWEGESPPGLGAELEFFFRGLEKESIVNPAWQGILSQYWSYGGEPYKHAKVIAEARVSAVVAPTKVTNAKIEEEIGEWIENGATVTPNTQFVVMLAPHSTYTEMSGCAYHKVGLYHGQEYEFDAIPYAGDADKYYGYNTACNRLTRLKTTEAEELIHSTTGAASHEFSEATTDPGTWTGEYPYTKRLAWIENESTNSEIADLCIDEEEDKKEYAIEELPAKNGRVGWTYVNKLWDDEGRNKCKLEDPPYSEAGPARPSPSAVDEPGSSGRNAFYVGGGGKIADWWVNGGSWEDVGLLGGGNEPVAADSSPSAVYEPSGSGRNVFYAGTNGGIWDWLINKGSWEAVELSPTNEPVRATTSPSAVYEPSGSGRNVFYIGANGKMWDWWVNKGAWEDVELAGGGANESALTDTSPSAVYESGSGRNVFYVGANGAIWDWLVKGGHWEDIELAGGGASESTATTPSAVSEPSGSGRNVFYIGANGKMWDWWVNKGAWEDVELAVAGEGNGGGADEPGSTAPSAMYEPGGSGRNVFYRGASGTVWDWLVNGSHWEDVELASASNGGTNEAVASETSPSAIYDASSHRNVFYGGSNGKMWDWWVNGSHWEDAEL
jgi:hypothetical protein